VDPGLTVVTDNIRTGRSSFYLWGIHNLLGLVGFWNYVISRRVLETTAARALPSVPLVPFLTADRTLPGILLNPLLNDMSSHGSPSAPSAVRLSRKPQIVNNNQALL
jgi:hypothetical protein